MVEEGRYRRPKIARGLKKCSLCSMDVVEDEYHFLLTCPAYSDIRKRLLPRYYCRWPSIYKFINQNSILKRLAKFIYEANVKRLAILNGTTVS